MLRDHGFIADGHLALKPSGYILRDTELIRSIGLIPLEHNPLSKERLPASRVRRHHTFLAGRQSFKTSL